MIIVIIISHYNYTGMDCFVLVRLLAYEGRYHFQMGQKWRGPVPKVVFKPFAFQILGMFGSSRYFPLPNVISYIPLHLPL